MLQGQALPLQERKVRHQLDECRSQTQGHHRAGYQPPEGAKEPPPVELHPLLAAGRQGPGLTGSRVMRQRLDPSHDLARLSPWAAIEATCQQQVLRRQDELSRREMTCPLFWKQAARCKITHGPD